MNIVFEEDKNGESLHPYSGSVLGTFPLDGIADGEEVAVFKFDPTDLETQGYRFTKRGKHLGISRMAQVVLPEYLFDENGNPTVAIPESDVSENQFSWAFEYLATRFGSFAQGLELDDAPMAGEYLGKLSKQRYLGYLKLNSQKNNSAFKRMMEENTNHHIRFVQAHKNGLSETCTRAVYLHLDFVPFEEELPNYNKDFSEYLRSTIGCDENDLCYAIVSQRPMEVQPCELSII